MEDKPWSNEGLRCLDERLSMVKNLEELQRDHGWL